MDENDPRRVNEADVHRSISPIVIELTGIVVFLLGVVALVVLTALTGPWALLGVVCAIACWAGGHAVIRPDPAEVDEPH